MLPTEATHSSLDLFEKPALLVTFDSSFYPKLGPVYRPNGPMLEFEVAGDKKKFYCSAKNSPRNRRQIVQASEAGLKYDVAARADVT